MSILSMDTEQQNTILTSIESHFLLQIGSSDHVNTNACTK